MDKSFDFTEHMKRFDAFLFGRKSYCKLKEAGGITFPGIKYYIFSNTLDGVDKDATLVGGNVREAVGRIKSEEGKDIAVFGGANLLTTLLDLELIDELDISLIPILLGEGMPMVNPLKQRIHLSPVAVEKLFNGTILLRYLLEPRQTSSSDPRVRP
jgi:dihydrofolate reductase